MDKEIWPLKNRYTSTWSKSIIYVVGFDIVLCFQHLRTTKKKHILDENMASLSYF